MLPFFSNRRKLIFHQFFGCFQQKKKWKRCSRRDLNPSRSLERASWLAATLREQKTIFFYPPEATCIIVISWSSLKLSSTGTGMFLLITITVSGLTCSCFNRSSTFDPFASWISLVVFVFAILTFIFNWIDTHIKKSLIKLFTISGIFAGVAKLGPRRRSRKPLVTTPQEFKSPPQRYFYR